MTLLFEKPLTLTMAEPESPQDSSRIYAITLDMDTEMLQRHYGAPSYANAYADIKKCLAGHGFTSMQGSVYFGDKDKINDVTCVLAAMDLASRFAWFAPSVRDICMLRIEELNDLMPAVQRAASS